MKGVHQCFCVAQIEPVATWVDDDECISHVQMRARFVLEFPTTPVISREASGSKRQMLEEGDEDSLVHYHPKRVLGAVGNDP